MSMYEELFGINNVANEIHDLAVIKGWWSGKKELPEILMLCVSELSEALEEYRNGNKEDRVYYSASGKPEGIPIELADCIIRILDFCGHAGIDIRKAISIKHEYNKQREYRHGGKVC